MFWNEPFFRRATLAPFKPASRLSQALGQFWPGFLEQDCAEGECAPGCCEAPAMNIWRQADHVRVAVLTPGLPADAVAIEVEQDLLTIRATAPAAKAESAANPTGDTTASAPTPPAPTLLRQERPAASFSRQVRLPFPVEAGAVRARLRHGVLWIDLPRAVADKPRKIEVHPGAGQ